MGQMGGGMGNFGGADGRPNFDDLDEKADSNSSEDMPPNKKRCVSGEAGNFYPLCSERKVLYFGGGIIFFYEKFSSPKHQVAKLFLENFATHLKTFATHTVLNLKLPFSFLTRGNDGSWRSVRRGS